MPIPTAERRAFLYGMADRDELIQSAIRFLRDEKVQAAPLTKRIAFLESKGLTQAEIETALAKVAAPSSSTMATTNSPAPPSVPPVNAPLSQPFGYAIPPPPPPPRLSWKDYVLVIFAAGGLSVAASVVFRRFVLPYFSIPSKKDLEEEKKALDEAFDKLETEMTCLREKAEKTVDQMLVRDKQVEQVIEKLEEEVKRLAQESQSRENIVMQVQKELDRIRTDLPRVNCSTCRIAGLHSV